MYVKTEKTFVVRMTAEEAGVMVTLLELVSGRPDSFGRKVTDSMLKSLTESGASGINVWDNNSTITAADID